MLNTRALCLAMLLISVAPAWADDAEDAAIAQVRLTTEPTMMTGCIRLGAVSDDSIKDLRRKVLRNGGNAAVISFGIQDLAIIQGDAYRCPVAASATPGIPQPPAGAPPPPPPARSGPPQQPSSPPPPPPAR
jgi:hypothetical protein